MSRPLRIEYPDAYYHVMNRGLAYQKIFTDRVDRELFLNLLGECHQMWGIEVFAYCLMGNYYHVLLQTPQANLSRIMRHLDGLYTQRYNRRHHRDGPLFRGRYKAIVVDEESYLLSVVRYIHR
ncbi:MAG TPA: transposase, partial [Nitrospiria bacterium]